MLDPQLTAQLKTYLERVTEPVELVASLDEVYQAEVMNDFKRVSGHEIVGVRLDRKRKRTAGLFIAEGFDPAPRDPVTGKPIPRRP